MRRHTDTALINPTGLIRVRELPRDCTEDDFRAWWPRLTEHEKDRYTVARFHNLVTSAGKAAIVLCLFPVPTVGTTVNVTAFAQKFAIGNGAVSGIAAGDTSLFGEVMRKAVTQGSNPGGSNQLDYSTFITNTDYASGLITNAGLIGGASGTALLTHFSCTYTKGANPISFDYLLTLT
jgi:hypothetical protein